MKKLNKKQAAAALKISVRSFERKIQRGLITGEEDPSQGGQHGQKFYSYAALGLTDPEKVKAAPADVSIDSFYEEPISTEEPKSSFMPRELSPREQKELDDLQYAEAYKSGNASDSFGNRIGSTRKTTMLGPVIESHVKPERIFGDAHMREELKAKTSGVSGNDSVLSSDAFQELWHPGTKARTAAMRRDAGLREPTQQERKQAVDIAVIRESFKHGYSR